MSLYDRARATFSGDVVYNLCVGNYVVVKVSGYENYLNVYHALRCLGIGTRYVHEERTRKGDVMYYYSMIREAL